MVGASMLEPDKTGTLDVTTVDVMDVWKTVDLRVKKFRT